MQGHMKRGEGMAKATAKTSSAPKATGADSPSKLIDARIKELGDWRGETLAHVRKLIHEACPGFWVC